MLDRLLRREPEAPVPMTLYTRAGCHLCDEMKAAIESTDLGAPYELAEVDVDADPELARSLGLSIPVLEIAGRTAFEGRLEPDALRREFARRAREWRP